MILLIRHGETAGNAERVVQRPETPLNERGLAQAEALAERLAVEPIRRILSSDLARAHMTAQAVHARHDVPLELEPLLQERNFGDARGTAYADLETDLFAPDFAPPRGETWEVFHERVDVAWARIRDVHADTPGSLAVVTHGLVCMSLVERHLTLSEPRDVGHWGNTALTVIEPAPPFHIRLLACTAHLSGDESRAGGRV